MKEPRNARRVKIRAQKTVFCQRILEMQKKTVWCAAAGPHPFARAEKDVAIGAEGMIK